VKTVVGRSPSQSLKNFSELAISNEADRIEVLAENMPFQGGQKRGSRIFEEKPLVTFQENRTYGHG